MRSTTVKWLVLPAAVVLLAGELWAQERQRPPAVTPFGTDAVLSAPAIVRPGDGVELTSLGPGMQAGAYHVVGLGCLIGNQLSWNWPHGGGSCEPNSCEEPDEVGCPNIGGPIGAGLLWAESVLNDPALLDAAIKVGNYEMTNDYNVDGDEFRFATYDPYFLLLLSQRTGDPSYSNHAAEHFFDKLSAGTYGPSDWDTAEWIGVVQTARSGALINLRPWEFSTLPVTAGSIGNAGQQDAFRDAILDGLNTLKQDINPSTEFGDVIGLAGAVRGLALNGTTSFTAISSPNHPGINGMDDLCELADYLVSLQNADGSWYWLSDPNETKTESDKDAQTTAYAVMALLAADTHCTDYSTQIAKGRNWLRSMQLPSGGFRSYPGGGENIEVEGEVLNALVPEGYLKLLPDSSCYTSIGGTVTVDIKMTDVIATIVGGQFFLEYDNTKLGFVSAVPGDPPFTLQIYEVVDEGQGTIDYAVGVGDPNMGTSDDTVMARLTFQTLAETCEESGLVSFRAHDPPTRLSDNQGKPITTELVALSLVSIDATAPVTSGFTVTGGDVDGNCKKTVTFSATVTDNCCLSADSVNVGVSLLIGNAILGTPVINNTQVNPNTVSISGSVEVSDLMSCPATVKVTVNAADCCGNAATPADKTADVNDATAPVITFCPPDISRNADAGGCTLTLSAGTIGAATATDNCDSSPLIEYRRSDQGLWYPASNTGPLTQPYPVGATTITWRATDACGNSTTCVQTVTVSGVNELVVSVELSPTMVAGPLNRCITFELYNGTTLVNTQNEVLTFTNGKASSVTVLVPCGVYTCATARDKLHTLRRTAALGTTGSEPVQYTVSFTGDPGTGGDWLTGGNLNDDKYIDILDFGVFSWQFGQNYGTGGTTCATPYPHADVNGDAVVNTVDFTFIQINFLKQREADCAGNAGPESGPITRISVDELREMGLPELAIGDLNHDGWLDEKDIEAFMMGQRPDPGGLQKAPAPKGLSR